ncbi:MAG: hypothetical protein V1792_20420 [Pseudomonadota bacterium]
MKSKDGSTIYIRVRDQAGKEYVCPLDALKDPKECTEQELRNCLDSTAEAFTDDEVMAIIRSEFRKD